MARRGSATTGFTLIEILVVMAIIAILVALIFPVFTKARAAARQASCMSNLRQIGMAMLMYRNDSGELAPHLSSLHPTYIPSPEILICPDDPAEGCRDGDDYMEGDLYLSSGVSYTYIPNWKYAATLSWWRPRPRYGPGKWEDSTPLAMCHWHWAAGKEWRKELQIPSWGTDPKGWVLVLAAGGSVHKVRAEIPADEFSPDCY
ncbi:MAG: DUF1559 domain-containing protein [Armatimonadota bacterium]|nr:MAG: DUF1559 domain-containing protein [Armatimonadota bacterium]